MAGHGAIVTNYHHEIVHLSARLRPSLGAATGLVLGLLALGPGLRRGFLLSYDMVFVPRQPFTSAMFGLSGGPPRAVPSDFAVALASRLLPADIVQKLVLLLIFVLACSGAAALLDREPALARLAAAVFYGWNPYLAERLIIGQWALLIGYAGLPWVLRAGLALARDQKKHGDNDGKSAARLMLALLPAIIGGFAAMAISALVLVPVALASKNARAVAISLAALAVGSLPWLIPSLLHAVYADPGGVAAFASRADTPFGTVGSLVMLGGMWNAATVPKAYGGPWSAIWLAVVLAALAGYALIGCRRPRRWPGLTIAALVSLAIACTGITEPGRALLRGAIRAWPGFAILRDAQQFIAPLALAEAIGFGLAVAWCVRPRPFGQKVHTERVATTPPSPAPPSPVDLALGVLAVVTPLLLLPGLAWGAAGRLRPAWYPASYLAAARAIDASPAPGAVLLLPWVADRTPVWNHGEVMLDAWPRLVSRQVIWNDGTVVGNTVAGNTVAGNTVAGNTVAGNTVAGNTVAGNTVAGNLALAPDDPAARRLDGVIAAGGPMTEALRAAGVRFVVVDGAPLSARDPRDARDTPAGARLPGAVRLYYQPELVVYQIPR